MKPRRINHELPKVHRSPRDPGRLPGSGCHSGAPRHPFCRTRSLLSQRHVGGKEGLSPVSEPGFSVFREAVLAVDRSAFGRLEGNLALLSAVRTDGLSHFAGAAEVPGTADVSVFSLIIHWIARADRTLPVQLQPACIYAFHPPLPGRCGGRLCLNEFDDLADDHEISDHCIPRPGRFR